MQKKKQTKARSRNVLTLNVEEWANVIEAILSENIKGVSRQLAVLSIQALLFGKVYVTLDKRLRKIIVKNGERKPQKKTRGVARKPR